MLLAFRKVHSRKVLLKELSCHGLISLKFLKFLRLLPLCFHRCVWLDNSLSGWVILSPEAVLCLDWCCRASQTHSLWKPPSCTETTKGSQLLQLLGLVLYGLGNWLYPVALILSCIISCTFFVKCHLKLLSLEYQLCENFTELNWTANVLFWKCSAFASVFCWGSVLTPARRDACTD